MDRGGISVEYGGRLALLPVDVQIQAGEPRRPKRGAGLDIDGIAIGKQVLSDPGKGFFTGTSRSIWMDMQEMGPESMNSPGRLGMPAPRILTLKFSVSSNNPYPPRAPCGSTWEPSHSGQWTALILLASWATAFSVPSLARSSSLISRSSERWIVSGPANSTLAAGTLALSQAVMRKSPLVLADGIGRQLSTVDR
jgi:hypothetical protein